MSHGHKTRIREGVFHIHRDGHFRPGGEHILLCLSAMGLNGHDASHSREDVPEDAQGRIFCLAAVHEGTGADAQPAYRDDASRQEKQPTVVADLGCRRFGSLPVFLSVRQSGRLYGGLGSRVLDGHSRRIPLPVQADRVHQEAQRLQGDVPAVRKEDRHGILRQPPDALPVQGQAAYGMDQCRQSLPRHDGPRESRLRKVLLGVSAFHGADDTQGIYHVRV